MKVDSYTAHQYLAQLIHCPHEIERTLARVLTWQDLYREVDALGIQAADRVELRKSCFRVRGVEQRGIFGMMVDHVLR